MLLKFFPYEPDNVLLQHVLVVLHHTADEARTHNVQEHTVVHMSQDYLALRSFDLCIFKLIALNRSIMANDYLETGCHTLL